MNSDLYPNYQNPLLEKPDRSLPREVAIIGAGTIGPDIGYYFKSALPDLRLLLVDVIEKPLENARKRIESYVRKALDRKKMKPDQAEAVGRNIVYTMDYEEIRNADLVIEAATENLRIKRKIVEQVENLVRQDTIITSNTSSIPAERIFSGVRNPERTTITHFFAPAWRNPAIEVIIWKAVDQKVVDYLRWMFCLTGKVPIISRSEICFVLDRIFDNWRLNDEQYKEYQGRVATNINEMFEDFRSLWDAKGVDAEFRANTMTVILNAAKQKAAVEMKIGSME